MENTVPRAESSKDAQIRYEVSIVNENNGEITSKRKIVKKPLAKILQARGTYSISYKIIERDNGETASSNWSNAKVISVNE